MKTERLMRLRRVIEILEGIDRRRSGQRASQHVPADTPPDDGQPEAKERTDGDGPSS